MFNIAGQPPIHPGEILREEVLPNLGMSVTEFSRRLGLTRASLYNILKEQSSVSTVVALKLAKLLGTSPEVWLNMQQAFDIHATMQSKAAEIASVDKLEVA